MQSITAPKPVRFQNIETASPHAAARVALPTLKPSKTTTEPSTVGRLSELAGKFAEIPTTAPNPPKPKPVKRAKPKVHQRPARGFD